MSMLNNNPQIKPYNTEGPYIKGINEPTEKVKNILLVIKFIYGLLIFFSALGLLLNQFEYIYLPDTFKFGWGLLLLVLTTFIECVKGYKDAVSRSIATGKDIKIYKEEVVYSDSFIDTDLRGPYTIEKHIAEKI